LETLISRVWDFLSLKLPGIDGISKGLVNPWKIGSGVLEISGGSGSEIGRNSRGLVTL